jgi:hypothetical protein
MQPSYGISVGSAGSVATMPNELRMDISNPTQGDFVAVAWPLNAVLHDRARLTDVDIFFVAQSSQMPSRLPRVQLTLRGLVAGQTPRQAMSMTPPGFVSFPAAADVNAWNDGGRVRQFRYTPTTLNAIDKNVLYELTIEFEPLAQGTHLLSIYAIDLHFADINDLQWP